MSEYRRCGTGLRPVSDADLLAVVVADQETALAMLRAAVTRLVGEVVRLVGEVARLRAENDALRADLAAVAPTAGIAWQQGVTWSCADGA